MYFCHVCYRGMAVLTNMTAPWCHGLAGGASLESHRTWSCLPIISIARRGNLDTKRARWRRRNIGPIGTPSHPSEPSQVARKQGDQMITHLNRTWMSAGRGPETQVTPASSFPVTFFFSSFLSCLLRPSFSRVYLTPPNARHAERTISCFGGQQCHAHEQPRTATPAAAIPAAAAAAPTARGGVRRDGAADGRRVATKAVSERRESGGPAVVATCADRGKDGGAEPALGRGFCGKNGGGSWWNVVGSSKSSTRSSIRRSTRTRRGSGGIGSSLRSSSSSSRW